MADSSMYETLYWQIQELLDEALGPEVEDGVGEGIVAEVAFALFVAEHRGYQRAIDALQAEAERVLRDEPRSSAAYGHARKFLKDHESFNDPSGEAGKETPC